MNSYIKVNNDDIEIVESLLSTNNIDYKTNFDPMVYVCEEMVNCYITHTVEDELKPLFRKAEDDMVEFLYEEACNILDGNFVIDVLEEFEIGDEE